jgi:hypothetical protein
MLAKRGSSLEEKEKGLCPEEDRQADKQCYTSTNHGKQKCIEYPVARVNGSNGVSDRTYQALVT